MWEDRERAGRRAKFSYIKTAKRQKRQKKRTTAGIRWWSCTERQISKLSSGAYLQQTSLSSTRACFYFVVSREEDRTLSR